nr:MAG TPA: Protein of unknown function (DUF434) [Caudoviricetes sp.]
MLFHRTQNIIILGKLNLLVTDHYLLFQEQRILIKRILSF